MTDNDHTPPRQHWQGWVMHSKCNADLVCRNRKRCNCLCSGEGNHAYPPYARD